MNFLWFCSCMFDPEKIAHCAVFRTSSLVANTNAFFLITSHFSLSLPVSLFSLFSPVCVFISSLGAGVINFDGQGVISYRFKVLHFLA